MPLTWEVYHESDKLFNESIDEGEESKEEGIKEGLSYIVLVYHA